MADQPTIHIDDDWKRQAQEEKRKLAEQAAAAKETSAPAAAAATPGSVASPPSAALEGRDPRSSREAASRREPAPASFPAIVQSFMTQALLYLGELAVRGGEPVLDLDMAKRQIDLLTILEEKTRGNLSADEQKLLDGVLYDLRNRFVGTASQFIM
jgi:hypothetical protein